MPSDDLTTACHHNPALVLIARHLERGQHQHAHTANPEFVNFLAFLARQENLTSKTAEQLLKARDATFMPTVRAHGNEDFNKVIDNAETCALQLIEHAIKKGRLDNPAGLLNFIVAKSCPGDDGDRYRDQSIQDLTKLLTDRAFT